MAGSWSLMEGGGVAHLGWEGADVMGGYSMACFSMWVAMWHACLPSADGSL